MKLNASFELAKRLIFPLAGKKTAARKSVIGAVVCIAISVVPLVTVLAVSDGMIDGMTDRIIGLSSGSLQARFYRSSPYIQSAQEFVKAADEIRSIDGVVNAYPEIGIDALAAGSGYRTGVRVRAVEPSVFTENSAFARYLTVCHGSFDGFVSGAKNAVVGEKTARTLGLQPGSMLRLITTKSSPDGTVSPVLSSFRVGAVISSGYQELDALWVFVPLDTAFSFVTKNNAFFSVMIETDNTFSPELYRTRSLVNERMRRNAVAYTWSELNASQFENFSSTKILLVFVMMLIVLVAAVNISSALIMLVMERRREIAILKSTGASSGGIALSFLLTGCFCGAAGCAAGLPFGIACALNINRIIPLVEKAVNFVGKLIFVVRGNAARQFMTVKLMDPAYYLTEISVKIQAGEIVFIVLAVLILSLIVSVVPAVKAGREKPLEILRND